MSEPEQHQVVVALFQVADGCTTLWDALADVLMDSKLVDNSELGCRISQIADAVKKQGRGGAIYDQIVQSAMKATVLREYATLEDAPEEVQKMCRGEGPYFPGTGPKGSA